jgi:hypothetical protein
MTEYFTIFIKKPTTGSEAYDSRFMENGIFGSYGIRLWTQLFWKAVASRVSAQQEATPNSQSSSN